MALVVFEVVNFVVSEFGVVVVDLDAADFIGIWVMPLEPGAVREFGLDVFSGFFAFGHGFCARNGVWLKGTTL